jgi:hypothetical protein
MCVCGVVWFRSFGCCDCRSNGSGGGGCGWNDADSFLHFGLSVEGMK